MMTSDSSESNHMPEVLAPAGSPAALQAALAAGANAVYFGLKKLNARRGAANFTQEELPARIQEIHAAGAKAYLTLNTQLSQREIGLAYRTLQAAQDAGVDAVLVTDPALLAVRKDFPKLQFHFSTQAAISSSAGVKAAKVIGIDRVVLARELSQQELAAAARCGIETEAFVQGAHCFSCSGRCLLSSWGGGRSGNRGACTSPCRVRWTNQKGTQATPLSMHDMALAPDMADLLKTGVVSLKIEGRLKGPEWVSSAVALYRDALNDPAHAACLAPRAQSLGAYTGRQVSDAYFKGVHENLTGDDEGRTAADPSAERAKPAQAASPTAVLSVLLDDKGGTNWTIIAEGKTDAMRIPMQRIANPRRAVTLASVIDAIAELVPKKLAFTPRLHTDDLGELLLPKNTRNTVLDFITVFFRRAAAPSDDGEIRNITLPASVRERLGRGTPEQARKSANPLPLNNARCTAARVMHSQLEAALEALHLPLIVQVQPETPRDADFQLKKLAAMPRQRLAAVALPEVIYEYHLPLLADMLAKLPSDLPIEVNGWDGWELARHTSHPLLAGQGMAVLNAAAAEYLSTLGFKSVSVSTEIDQEQLEDLSNAACVPLVITLLDYPRLMMTRAELPVGFRPEDNATLTDSRAVSLRPVRIGAMTALHATTPLDWRALQNPKITAARYIEDLRGSLDFSTRPKETPFLFNYDRRLR